MDPNLPIILLNDRGEVQSRSTFSEFASDNGDGIGLDELAHMAATLRSTGEARVNMGAGGVFVLRAGSETNYQAAVAVCVTSRAGDVPMFHFSSPEEWEAFAEFCADCASSNESPARAAELWILAAKN